MKHLVAFIGMHSCLVGIPLIVAPVAVLRIAGFPEPIHPYFPSMAGVFLVMLGICYLRALTEPALVFVILLSKASAVVFLVVQAVWLSAPPVIWVMLVGDAAMLAGVALLNARQGPAVRQQHVPAAVRAPADHEACRTRSRASFESEDIHV